MKNILIASLLFVCASLLFAHGMKIEVSISENGTVSGVAKYSADAPVANASVTVTNTDGEKVYTGKTDENGAFTFQVTEQDAYTIKVRQGGHQGTYTIKAEDLPE